MKSCVCMLVILLFQWHGARAMSDMDTISSCNGSVSIECSNPLSPRIFICHINTTEHPAPLLLENCNAHSQCLVPNPDNTCLEVQYKCLEDKPKLQLEKSAGELRTNSSLFYLMSENYLKGQHQSATNISCHLQFGNHGNQEQMHFIIQEFATLLNSSDFCLHVHNSSVAPYCSGSGKFFDYYGPFHSTSGWNFSLTLDGTPSTLPELRFWLAIAGQAEESDYHLKCTSSAVSVTSLGTLALVLLSLMLSQCSCKL